MSIQDEAKLHMLPVKLRADVNGFLRGKPYEYADIINAEYSSVYEGSRLRGLCIHLAKRGHTVGGIILATGMTQKQVISTIRKNKRPDFPIRSQWGFV